MPVFPQEQDSFFLEQGLFISSLFPNYRTRQVSPMELHPNYWPEQAFLMERSPKHLLAPLFPSVRNPNHFSLLLTEPIYTHHYLMPVFSHQVTLPTPQPAHPQSWVRPRHLL
jgi:hypothetical protein